MDFHLNKILYHIPNLHAFTQMFLHSEDAVIKKIYSDDLPLWDFTLVGIGIKQIIDHARKCTMKKNKAGYENRFDKARYFYWASCNREDEVMVETCGVWKRSVLTDLKFSVLLQSAISSSQCIGNIRPGKAEVTQYACVVFQSILYSTQLHHPRWR